MELPENETVTTVVTKDEVDDELEAPMQLIFGIQLHPDTWSLLVFTTAVLFLTINAVSSVFQSLDDLPAVAVVVSVYVLLVLLLLCVHLLDGLPEPSPERQLLKVPVWLLSTALNFIFAWRFSSVLPLPLAAFGWCLAGVTGLLGFYFLVVYRDQEKEDEEVEYYYDCEKLAYLSMPNKV